MNKLPMSWYNFDTKQYDYLSDTPPTDEEALHYIENNPAARSLYALYRSAGKTIVQAMINTYCACIGEPARFPLEDENNTK